MLMFEQHGSELLGSTHAQISSSKDYSTAWSTVGWICRHRTSEMEGQLQSYPWISDCAGAGGVGAPIPELFKNQLYD